VTGVDTKRAASSKIEGPRRNALLGSFSRDPPDAGSHRGAASAHRSDREGLLSRACGCISIMHDEEQRLRDAVETWDITALTCGEVAAIGFA
jgi:hypothetical protein